MEINCDLLLKIYLPIKKILNKLSINNPTPNQLQFTVSVILKIFFCSMKGYLFWNLA